MSTASDTPLKMRETLFGDRSLVEWAHPHDCEPWLSFVRARHDDGRRHVWAKSLGELFERIAAIFETGRWHEGHGGLIELDEDLRATSRA